MPDDSSLPAPPPPAAIEVLRAAAEATRLENADLTATLAGLSVEVRIRNRQTGAERTVARSAVPFFTNQGFERVDDEPAPDPQTPGRHEASEPADAADPGASTTPTPPNKEN